MMFITPRGERKCIVFMRKDDEGANKKKDKEVSYSNKSVKQGNIVAKITIDHLRKDDAI